MKWFGNLKTATKIISAFLIVSLILAGLGVFSIFSLRGANANMKEMYNNNLISVRDLSAAQIKYQSIRVALRDMSIAKAAEEISGYKEQIEKATGEIEQYFNNYRPLATTPKEQELLGNFDKEYEIYMKMFSQGLILAEKEDPTEFNAYRSQLAQQGEKVVVYMNGLIDENVRLAAETNKHSQDKYSSALVLTLSVVIGAVIVSILIGYVIARSISRPLMVMLGLASEVANGNLTQKADISTKDEVGQLASALNRMVDNLKDLINGIVMNSQSVA
ncbi:chemotaxis protein, partial [Paenibacillus riograndensis]